MYTYESLAEGLQNPLPSTKYLEELADFYDECADQRIRGMAGLQLFITSAEARYAEPDAEFPARLERLREPDDYLCDDAVVTALFDYCKLPPDWRDRLPGLCFHKTGTTSVILQSNRAYALKVIRPRFQNVPTITAGTAQYKKRVRLISHTVAPKIHESAPLWIVMSFIDGVTLTQFAAEHLSTVKSIQVIRNSGDRGTLTEEQLTSISDILDRVCTALSKCAHADPAIHHLDLSPDNIIVSTISGALDIRLIDFGVNYLLKEHVGSVGGLSRAQNFIAPELQTSSCVAPELADVYSLGMILLELVAQHQFKKEQLTTELDAVWNRYPDIAELVEDMIEEHHPEARLTGTPRGAPIFEALTTKIREATNSAILVRQLTPDTRSPVDHVIDSLFNSIVPRDSIKELIARWRGAAEGGEGLRRLLYWSVGVQATHLLAVSIFCWSVLFFPAKRLCTVLGWCLAAVNAPPLPPQIAQIGPVNGLLPGRLVALTFSFTLARYYANIFATVTLRDIRLPSLKPQVRRTEWLMRWHPAIGSLPILWALVIDPKAWPYCCALGLVGIFFNNLATYRLAAGAYRVAVEQHEGNDESPFTRSSTFLRERLDDFDSWWFMILVYLICLVGLGVLLSRGVAQDEWMYAAIVCIINMFQMFRNNCTKMAPGVRTILRRTIWRLTRVEVFARVAAEHKLDSTAAVAAQ